MPNWVGMAYSGIRPALVRGDLLAAHGRADVGLGGAGRDDGRSPPSGGRTGRRAPSRRRAAPARTASRRGPGTSTWPSTPWRRRRRACPAPGRRWARCSASSPLMCSKICGMMRSMYQVLTQSYGSPPTWRDELADLRRRRGVVVDEPGSTRSRGGAGEGAALDDRPVDVDDRQLDRLRRAQVDGVVDHLGRQRRRRPGRSRRGRARSARPTHRTRRPARRGRSSPRRPPAAGGGRRGPAVEVSWRCVTVSLRSSRRRRGLGVVLEQRVEVVAEAGDVGEHGGLAGLDDEDRGDQAGRRRCPSSSRSSSVCVATAIDSSS